MSQRETVPISREDAMADDTHCCASCMSTVTNLTEPVEVSEYNLRRNHGLDLEDSDAFCLSPMFGPLLFDNETSDCRDHCANERTFLSYLRLSIYMAIVSVAIVLSFHLRRTATEKELRMATPLGVIFLALSVSCLGVGLANYIETINKYGRKTAIVQSGWKTQVVMVAIGSCIIGSCIALLVLNKLNEQGEQ
ncbi:hypothetical protein QBC37DRAFT_420292 [Rhypophila decipiens]|uniref:DUF202 domain-containing protein n=1 Tax=Rhypophila decipiens TaxID=261697 RepID=A0AAN6YEX0_9PEZI|nr:hypothetical protein QBC37DRAFT_420292 [Rhypophila decipiens]